MKLSILAVVLAVMVMVSACMPATPAPSAPQPQPTAVPAEPTKAPEPMAKDIVDTAVGNGSFTTLVAAVQAAGLVDTLKGAGPFTVFAPTDEAFKKLPAGTVEALLKDPAKLKDILLYHVVAGKVMAADAAKLTSADTVLGKPIAIKVVDGKVMINDATVAAADVAASNGVIHVIDTVLLPPAESMAKDIVDTAVGNGSFTTLVAAVQAAGLVDTLKGAGPFTVFAPTDEAFKKLPAGTVEALLKDPAKLKDILLYHVVAGKVMAADAAKLTSADTVLGKPIAIKVVDGKVMINDATVAAADVAASNGVIHVIDTVLLPPAESMAKDIVDTAFGNGSFTTLVAAVQAAGLVDTLKGAGPFTVFAPTDEAFKKLPAGTVEALLKDPAALKDILLYHVVAGKVMAADAVKLDSADTVLGKPITIKVVDGKVMINDATVAAADVAASNGVIHVIDTVLLPPAEPMVKDIVDTAVANGSFTTLVAAVQAAGLVDTLKGAGPFTVFAPTDEAFKKLPAGTVEALLKDPAKLKDILLYHVVAGKVMAADAAKLTSADTVLGKPIAIKVVDGKVMINDATVAAADVAASNGVIHVIDTVLLPPSK